MMQRRHVLLAWLAAALSPLLGCGQGPEDKFNAPIAPEDIQEYPDGDLPRKRSKPRTSRPSGRGG